MQDLIGREVEFAIVGEDVLGAERRLVVYYGTLDKIEGTMIHLKNNTTRPDKKGRSFDVWVNTASYFFFWIKERKAV